jgi:phosphoglycerate dehydrogenase-like enzyme
MSTKLFDCLAISSPSFSQHSLLVSEASALANRVVTNTLGTKFDETALAQFLNDAKADAAIIGTDPLSATVISSLQHLKAIGKYGVGCDNVDVPELKRKGIHFGWAGGVNRRSVSELALGFMLGHQRNIFRSVDRMQRGVWQKQGGVQLSEKTIGIVGFGYIGTDLAALLRPFGCQILVHDILDKREDCRKFSATQVPFDELLTRSDVITLHVPGGPATRGLIGKNELARVKANLLLINTARGEIVDFAITQSAVKNHQIAGYASDVFPAEPLLSNDFSIENGFYFTPHIGGNAQEAVLAMGRAAIEGLRSFSR